MNQDLSTLMANLAMLQIEVEKLEFRWQQAKAKARPAKSYVQRLWQGIKTIVGWPRYSARLSTFANRRSTFADKW